MIRTALTGLVFGYGCVLAAEAAGGALDGPVAAQVVQVVDGDTLRVRAQIWLDQEITVKVRLADIDAPELRSADCTAEKDRARAAHAFLAAWVEGRAVTLTDIRHDKYGGRVAARAADAQGRDLSDGLVAAGHAAPYGEAAYCRLADTGPASAPAISERIARAASAGDGAAVMGRPTTK